MRTSTPQGSIAKPRRSLSESAATILVVAVAFALRLRRLEDASVWWDEGLAAWAARMPLSEMARWTAADVHPPLYFALLHYWRLVAGDSELALRLPSVFAGTLAVVALYRLGRTLAPGLPWVAVSGAAYLALSRFAVWWSQEARMYALGSLLCVLSLLFAVRLARRWNGRDVIGYLLVTVAALWTLYLMAFLLVIEGLYWLWTLRDRPTWREKTAAAFRWAALLVAALGAFAPWLLFALPRMRAWSVQEPFEPRVFLQLYATLLSLGVSTDVDDVRAVVVVCFALVAAGALAMAVSRRPGARGATLLLLLTVLLPPAVVWLVTTAPRSFGYSPKPEARYLLPYAPAFYLLAAWAIVALARLTGRLRRPLALAAFAALIGWQTFWLADYFAGRLRVDDYPSAALTLKAHYHPGDLVLLHTDAPWPVFAYHWPGAFKGTPHLQDADPPGVEYFLKPLWEDHEAVWLVVNEDALRVDPQLLFEGWLAKRAVSRTSWRFGSTRVELFAKTEPRARSATHLAEGLALSPTPDFLQMNGQMGDLALVGWEQPIRRVRPGDALHVAAYVVRKGSGGELSISLDESGRAEASAPISAGEGIVRLALSLPVPADAVAGPHPLVVRLRSASSSPASAAETIASARLSSVEVVPTGPARPTAAGRDPETLVGATFGSPPFVRLVGYDLSGSPTVGGAVSVTLHWEVLRSEPTSYKVFVHLLSPAGRVAAQRDDFPVRGERRTSTWRPGEVVVDRYDVELRPDVAPGVYPVRVGFYDPVTGRRLGPARALDGAIQADDQIEIGRVEVKAPSPAS